MAQDRWIYKMETRTQHLPQNAAGIDDEEFQTEYMNRCGEQGWELVSCLATSRDEYPLGRSDTSYRYVWKKPQ